VERLEGLEGNEGTRLRLKWLLGKGGEYIFSPILRVQERTARKGKREKRAGTQGSKLKILKTRERAPEEEERGKKVAVQEKTSERKSKKSNAGPRGIRWGATQKEDSRKTPGHKRKCARGGQTNKGKRKSNIRAKTLSKEIHQPGKDRGGHGGLEATDAKGKTTETNIVDKIERIKSLREEGEFGGQHTRRGEHGRNEAWRTRTPA